MARYVNPELVRDGDGDTMTDAESREIHVYCGKSGIGLSVPATYVWLDENDAKLVAGLLIRAWNERRRS